MTEEKHLSPLERNNSLSRSMNLSIASGATGTLWAIVCAPQAIFNVFVTNHLGASSAQLGLLVGILSFASVLQLCSIAIYRHLPRRKRFWILTSLIHRLNGPVLALVAFSVFRGGSKETGFAVIVVAMIASWMMANVSSSWWWSWMADLVPISVRARFFGRRSAVSQVVNIGSFFATTVILDAVAEERIFLVYGIVFLIAGAGGVVDILLHVLIPESGSQVAGDRGTVLAGEPSLRVAANGPDAPAGSSARFFAPIVDRNFRRFSLITGMVLFSINVSAPFFGPYVTSPDAIGAPNTWLGIMFVISQLTWISVASGWGAVMDRFGRKPVVMIGLVFTLSWVGYLILSPSNYEIVLPIIALLTGLLAPAFSDGIHQFMLGLTPEKDRLTYIAWYWTICGVVSAGGSVLGGNLDDIFRSRNLSLGFLQIEGFQVVVVTSLVLVGISTIALSRIKEGDAKPVGFVFSRVANPGIFRTFLNIGALARTAYSERVARTLRSIDSSSDEFATDQILDRIQDPDAEVREEAIRALGRLRSPEAADVLLGILNDPASLNRVQAARALGRIGDNRVILVLVDAMVSASDELREACATAIGEIGGEASISFLAELLRSDHSDAVAAGGASAVSRHGVIGAAWELIPRLHRTQNPVLRTQLAIALANILGRPGEFYRYVTGADDQQQARVRKLFHDAERALIRLLSIDQERAVSVFSAAGAGDYDRAMTLLYHLASTADESATTHDPGLGLWRWYLEQTAKADATSSKNRRTEFLVACYFLKARTDRQLDRGNRGVAGPG